jgi:IS5 family transposase
MVTIACVHDSKAVYLLTRNLRELCCNIKIILSDAGYRGEIADKIKIAFGYMLEIVVNGDKVNTFKPIGKRWGVERIFAWFGNYRRDNNGIQFSSCRIIPKQNDSWAERLFCIEGDFVS